MKKVSMERKRYIMDDFFKVEEAYLHFEKSNGEMSPLVRRLKLERGNSARLLASGEDIKVLEFTLAGDPSPKSPSKRVEEEWQRTSTQGKNVL